MAYRWKFWLSTSQQSKLKSNSTLHIDTWQVNYKITFNIHLKMHVNFIILKKKTLRFQSPNSKTLILLRKNSNFDLANYCFWIIIWVCFTIRFGVTESMIAPFLEGFTLSEAIANNRVFITDLEILEGIDCQKGLHVSHI